MEEIMSSKSFFGLTDLQVEVVGEFLIMTLNPTNGGSEGEGG